MNSSPRQVAGAVYMLKKSGQSTETLVKSLAAYLVFTHKTNQLGRILRELEKLLYDRDGQLEIEVTTAREINQEVVDDIKRLFPAKKHVINTRIDHNLVGGATVKSGQKWLDLSVLRKIMKLQNTDYQRLKG